MNNNNNNNSATLSLLENAIINGFLNYTSATSTRSIISSEISRLNQPIAPRYQMEGILNNILNINNLYSSTNYNQAIETSMQEDTSVKHILSEKGKQKLNIVLYNEKTFPDKICPIYQTPFTHHEKITQLPCKHIFKSEAIMHWLEKEKQNVRYVELNYLQKKHLVLVIFLQCLYWKVIHSFKY